MADAGKVEVSRAQEDFLKTTYLLRSAGRPTTNSRIAQAMDISPAAASGMAQRLGKMGLLTYLKYQEIRLTDKGRMVALEILRHHRLLELFFTETLDVPWELVHQIADKFEHDLDEVLEDAIDAYLQSPSVDPHGDPIPGKDGTMPVISSQLLGDLPVQRPRLVTRVMTQEQEKLAYLGSIGLRPQARIAILEKKPLNGPIRVLINDEENVISHEIAHLIVVSETDLE